MKKLLSFFIAALVVVGCKDDDNNGPKPCYDAANPNCENYDPCFGKDSVRATFAIEQYLSSSSSLPDSLHYVEEEYFFWPGTIRFVAREDDADYTWYLGSEVIKDRQFERHFGNVDTGTAVGVSLVTEKTPQNLDCFPNDDGRDSVYREFKIRGRCSLDIANMFKGVFDENPDDSVVLGFTFQDPATGECGYPLYRINFNQNNDTTRFNFTPYYSNSLLVQKASGSNYAFDGWAKYDVLDETMLMKYRYRDSNYVFRGKLLKP